MPPESGRPPDMIRVLIVDDHAVVREGIRHVLSSDPDFEVVGEAAGGELGVTLAESLKPDVVILDLSMPDLPGLEAARRIRAQLPRTALLVLSIHDHQEYVLRSIEAGAQGYLRKDSSPRELRNAIRAVYEGSTFFSAPVARHVSVAIGKRAPEETPGTRGDTLTPRERSVLVEIAHGRTNKEIAGTLGVSVRTIESHRESLLKKLGVRGTAGLTRFAIEAGLLAP
ncbi:MAG TPA: response regulator transcription factor [Gemmatimonadaceae bacterium]|nr:response regulator transcription factor [Gemmatimonadaceae bacterium]